MRYLIICLAMLPLIAQDAPKPAAAAPAPAEAKKEEAKPEAKEEKADKAKDKKLTGDFEVGAVLAPDPRGNRDAYKTIVNRENGAVANFDLSLANPSGKLYDRMTLFGSTLFQPNQALRVNIEKTKVYDFRFDYRDIVYYNFLGSFANPLVDRGVFKTEQGFDTRRHVLDTEIRFTGTRFIPFFAYGRNWSSGKGVSTYVTGITNEYPVAAAFDDHADTLRMGGYLEFTKFHATIEQGFLNYSESVGLSNSATLFGSRQGTVLGQTLSLNSLSQSQKVSGSGMFTRLLGTYTPASWLDIGGSFMRSEPKTDVTYSQTASGNFTDPLTMQVLSAQAMSATTNASQPHRTGGINVEVRPMKWLRILESWMTDRYETASVIALNNTSFITTPVFPRTPSDRLTVNYSREQLLGIVDLGRWLSVRGGYRKVWGDAQTRAPIETGVSMQSGKLDQDVVLLGAQFRLGKKLWVNGDGELATSKSIYFRTSLGDYNKGSVKARYQLFNSLSLTANVFALTNDSPTQTARFDLKNYQESVGLLWNPKDGKRMVVMADYTHSDMRSTVGYYGLPFFNSELSLYNEHSHTGTVLADLVPAAGKHMPKLSLGGSFFTSGGSRPTAFYSPIFKLYVPLHERIQALGEWRYYGLGEKLYPMEGFRTNVFVAGVRFSM